MTIAYRMRHDGATKREAGPTVITTHLGRRPADFTDVRATNLAVVLGYVRANAPCSRADIAASTGLNKATVSSLVGELIGRRLLRETGLSERRIGRPATMIVLDGSPYAVIGLSIGSDELTVVATDLAGERLLTWHRRLAGGATNTALTSVAALAKRAQTRLRDEGRQVLGVSVGVPGLVDATGTVRVAPSLGWRDAPVRETLLRALGDPPYPVVVENDAQLAVLAEHRYGPYAGAQNLIFVTGGPDINAGIIAAGQLVRGGLGYAGEIGHVTVDPTGPQCLCGRLGCLSATASVTALLRQIGQDPNGDLGAEVDEVIRRAKAQEPAVIVALRDLGRHLGYGVGVLANVLNPEVVILGGHYVPLASWLLPAAQEELAARAIAPDAGGLRLVASALGYEAAAVGGAARALDSVDTAQLPLAID